MKTSEKQDFNINWSQIYSLAALNAAVVISWIAYHDYQPKVLEKFGYTELSSFLSIAQALVLVFIPPIAGYIGDIVIKKSGNRFLVFTIGAGVTAMTFMAVAFSVTGTIEGLRVVLPFMIVVWLISMNIFHSPANSMLELFAPAKQLPLVMSVIVLITELLYSVEPILITIVDAIGAVLTFVTGGVLLIITGYFFKKTTSTMNFTRSIETETRTDNFLYVILAGILVGCVDTAITNDATLMKWFGDRFVSLSTTADVNNYVICGILFVTAVSSFFVGRMIEQQNLKNLLFLGSIASAVVLTLLYFIPNIFVSLILCVLLGMIFSVLIVAAFPFAISHLSARNITLGTGLFFGSFKIADAIVAWISL